jgi:hypothetical protein
MVTLDESGFLSDESDFYGHLFLLRSNNKADDCVR